MTATIICILVTMMFSAFFSGMEIAFVSSNRMLAQMDREKNEMEHKGNKPAYPLAHRAIAFFYKHPNNFVSTMLVGNNIALVVYGILFAVIFDNTLFISLSDSQRVAADTILSTMVVLFTGEFLPKSLFKSNPNSMLRLFALPALACYIILWPISKFATFLANSMLKLTGVKIDKEKKNNAFSKIDLDFIVQSSIDNAKQGQQIQEEVRIFHNALDFSDTKVKDCMIPRTEIEAVDIKQCDTLTLRNKFIESGFSKIIVYDDDIDNIVGYIHSAEMFRNPDNWKNAILTMPFVPETMAAQKMMHTLLQQKKSLAVVVDEFGGTSGIVALEDIVEEIFGDIQDEHDSDNYVAKQTGEREFILSARLEIDKANQLLNLKLPESDNYQTVGGLILNAYQSFPKLNEIVNINNLQFKILKSTNTKIELVKLKLLE